MTQLQASGCGSIDRDAGAETHVLHQGGPPRLGPASDVPDNDIALFDARNAGAPGLEPLRMIEAGETGLWAAGEAGDA